MIKGLFGAAALLAASVAIASAHTVPTAGSGGMPGSDAYASSYSSDVNPRPDVAKGAPAN